MTCFRISVLLLLAWAATVCAQPATKEPALKQPALTTVRAVRTLTPSEAARGLPVRLDGVVTVRSGWKNSFFFQDRTAGISADPVDPTLDLHAGQHIVLEGTTAPGSFAPILHVQHVTLHGHAPLPPARLHSTEEMLRGTQDSQWIAIQGTVRAEEVQYLWNRPVLLLSIDTGDASVVPVRIAEFENGRQPNLVGASVRIAGVCATLFNHHRQLIGLRLFASSLGAVTVLEPAPAKPFDRPLQPLDSLLQFHSKATDTNLLRIAGTVTWRKQGSGFYLQSGNDAIFVDWKFGMSPAVDTAVEVVGYPSMGHGSTRMQAAFVRTADPEAPVVPRYLPARDMILVHDGFTVSPSENLLVEVHGKLLGTVPGAQQTTLLLEEDSTVFTARVPSAGADRYPRGTVLKVSGISTIDYDDYTNEPSAFYLQVRSPADIAVVQKAPWWNARHAANVAESLAFVIVLLIAIILFLRQAALRSLATTDSLTGLINRRTLLRSIDRLRQNRRRSEQTLRLLFIDVDRFKQINDRHGHRGGDLALKQVARLLEEAFPESDAIARIGGDEFVVVIQNISAGECEGRIGSAVARVNSSGVNAFDLSLSTGILDCLPQETAVPVEDLLERADRLMYRHKRRSGEQAGFAPPAACVQQA